MSLATRIGEEFNLVRDEGMARLNAIAPYNGVLGTDTKQQQENLVFSTTVGNEYKLADTSRFRKIDGKVIDTYGTQTIDFSRSGQHPFEVYTNTTLTTPSNVLAGDYVVTNVNDTIYRATKDSSDMYDYELLNTGATLTTVAGDVVFSSSSGIGGIQANHYYLNIVGNTTININNPLLLPDWIDLGTPSTMSLQNPYFETRDYISNQVLAMQKQDGTIHTKTLFVDAYAVETTNAVLIKNGWSKLENGLYSKGTVVGTPVGYFQSLNKGRYSPIFNSLGVFKDTASKNWYEAGVVAISSAYDCFSSIGTVTARPDSKSDKYVYTDQFRDLRTNAEKANIPQLLNECSTEAVNGSLGGYSDLDDITSVTSYKTKLTVEDLEGSSQTVWSLTNKAITVHQVLKSTDSGATWTLMSFTHQSVANTITTVASDLIKVSYTSSNPVANISTPKAVQQVGNYAVATNSNEIAQGQNLIQLIGKVGTSNISNRLEAVNLSNTIINTDGTFNTIPKNTALTLNSTVSPAIKTLSTIATADDGELLYQVFGEEGKLNTTWGFDTDFSQLTNGTLIDLNGATVKTVVATIGTGVYK